MSNPDTSNAEQIDLYDVAHYMAGIARHLKEAMDDELEVSEESLDNLESHLEDAQKSEQKRRMELDAKRDRIQREFSSKWKRN